MQEYWFILPAVIPLAPTLWGGEFGARQNAETA
jgi:hypothetical protein